MEDVMGTGLQEFIKIAMNLTTVIGGIHHQGYSHKNINPSNIQFEPKTKDIKIIDFGIATQVQQDIQPNRVVKRGEKR